MAEFSQLVSIYQPHIDKVLETPLNPNLPPDYQSSIEVIRQKGRKVLQLVKSFQDYMQVVADCIENRNTVLQRLQQCNRIIAPRSEPQQQSRSQNAQIVIDAEASVRMARESLKNLRDIG